MTQTQPEAPMDAGKPFESIAAELKAYNDSVWPYHRAKYIVYRQEATGPATLPPPEQEAWSRDHPLPTDEELQRLTDDYNTRTSNTIEQLGLQSEQELEDLQEAVRAEGLRRNRAGSKGNIQDFGLLPDVKGLRRLVSGTLILARLTGESFPVHIGNPHSPCLMLEPSSQMGEFEAAIDEVERLTTSTTSED